MYIVKIFYINIILSYRPNIEKNKFADFCSMVSSKSSIDKSVLELQTRVQPYERDKNKV